MTTTDKVAVTLDNAKYANLSLVTEVYPYEIVRVISETTVEIREMKATLDPTWKPEITPGGFAGHCSNQHSQRWIYESDESAPIIRMRKVKPSYRNGYKTWKSAMGGHRLNLEPKRFYDYNF